MRSAAVAAEGARSEWAGRACRWARRGPPPLDSSGIAGQRKAAACLAPRCLVGAVPDGEELTYRSCYKFLFLRVLYNIVRLISYIRDCLLSFLNR